jgi:hypothetical protein
MSVGFIVMCTMQEEEPEAQMKIVRNYKPQTKVCPVVVRCESLVVWWWADVRLFEDHTPRKQTGANHKRHHQRANPLYRLATHSGSLGVIIADPHTALFLPETHTKRCLSIQCIAPIGFWLITSAPWRRAPRFCLPACWRCKQEASCPIHIDFNMNMASDIVNVETVEEYMVYNVL